MGNLCFALFGQPSFSQFWFDILASAVMATMASTVKTIVVELEIDWRHRSMRDVLRKAGEVLGIESAGLTASQMARCCISELYDADATSVTVCRRKERCCQA